MSQFNLDLAPSHLTAVTGIMDEVVISSQTAVFPLLERLISALNNPFISAFAAWSMFVQDTVALCDTSFCVSVVVYIMRCHRNTREERAFDAALRALLPSDAIFPCAQLVCVLPEEETVPIEQVRSQ